MLQPLTLFVTPNRFHIIGLLFLFFLDIGDIWLELSKMLFYLKSRGERECCVTRLAAGVCFGVFAVELYVQIYVYFLHTQAHTITSTCICTNSMHLCTHTYDKHTCIHIHFCYSALFRIYWFPTKVIYSAMYISSHIITGGPYYLLFVPLLWLNFSIQVN